MMFLNENQIAEFVFKNENDKEWRYGIFRYNPGKQETIENGVKSWAGK